ncbi:uncharacterized protein JCM6883_005415 [Sporobolomyces salmoneus]|uniref:uncharacterized protein n=1 Tax=Sporobolomyces salmoneus TaxID=183962 RepID=UPI00316E2BFD
MAAALTPFQDDDDWNTPAPSLASSPAPQKCCDLPDYDPSTRRNHSRTTNETKGWNTGSYPQQAPPLSAAPPPRPKPIRLATPNTGYPFPYVLSRPTTPLEQPNPPPRVESDDSSTSSSSTTSDDSHSRAPSSSFSDSDSSTLSSHCSTPRDGDDVKPGTPHEIQQRRLKNAASTPGAPPPMGFAGKGHASSFIDYEDVKGGTGTKEEEEREERETTPKSKLSKNHLLLSSKLEALKMNEADNLST